MKLRLLTVLMVTLAINACKGPQKESAPGEKFGKEITADKAISFDDMITQISGQDSLRTKFKATVESVCKAKGCWMNLVSSEGVNDPSIFVKFKDYGFFMPLDIAGKEVIVEGVAYREVTPVDELRHYAEDEGKPEEEIMAITEPKEELKFMADGVIVL
jgi:hypothetical protein